VDRVVDSLGLVVENSFLVTYFPAVNKALVFRVKSRANRGFEVVNYGPLPLTAGSTVAVYGGGSKSVPADGVLPAMSYVSEGLSFPSPYTGVVEDTDMWYLTQDYRERLFHVIQYVTPSWIRIDCQIPKGVVQPRFQRDKVMLGVDRDWGFSRGRYEVVHFPEIHYGYRYGNDTNIDVYTTVRFVYGEYVVETPRDPELIFSILAKKTPAYWLTMPIYFWDPSIRDGLLKTYGIEGFTVYGVHEKEKAIIEYETLLTKVKV